VSAINLVKIRKLLFETHAQCLQELITHRETDRQNRVHNQPTTMQYASDTLVKLAVPLVMEMLYTQTYLTLNDNNYNYLTFKDTKLTNTL